MRKTIALALVMIIFLSSCGINPKESTTGTGDQDTVAWDTSGAGAAAEWWDQVVQAAGAGVGNYRIQETVIPNPDAALYAELGEGGKIWEQDLRMKDGVIYRVAEIHAFNRIEKSYLQILKSPYDQWVTVDVTEPAGVQVEGDFEAWYVREVIGEKDEAVYCTMWPWSPEQIYLGRYDQDGLTVVQELTTISEEFRGGRNVLWSDIDNNVYYYGMFSDSVLTFTDDYEEERIIPMSVRAQEIWGMVWEPCKEAACCYGSLNNRPGIWTVEEGEMLLDGFEGLQSFTPGGQRDLAAAINEEGTVYLADRQELWSYNGDSELLLRFQDRDYIMTEVYGMEVLEDGGLLIFANVDGETCVLELQENSEVQTAKEEVVLALMNEDRNLQRAVTHFNRRSDKYHVTVNVLQKDYDPFSENDSDELQTKMRLLLSTGQGPDIFSDAFVPFGLEESYAAKGVLDCVNDVPEEGEQYLRAALEGGMLGGNLYGIPYDCGLQYAVYSKSFAGDRTSWTMPELMEAVRNSDAKVLHDGLRGFFIVRDYGLSDDGNTAYIDWEKGESHLDEKPFIELLEFAKEYSDDRGNRDDTLNMSMLASGELVAVGSYSNEPVRNMNYLNGCFRGEPALLGYPRTEGNGIYVSTQNLYLNNSAQCKEGAKEFLRFLISAEEQRRLVTKASARNGRDMSTPFLPVNMEAVDTFIATCIGMWAGDMSAESDSAITDEDIETFRWLLEQAHPARSREYAIIDIIWEELEPYFAGDVSAKEAARKLDNRVQLYLDERK